MSINGNGGDGFRGAPRFTVGIVLSTGLKVVQASLFRLLGIIFAVAIPTVVVIAILVVVVAGAAPNGEGGLSLTLTRGTPTEALFLLSLAVVALVAHALIQAAITHGTLETLRGRKPAIGACLARAFTVLPQTFGASLILFVVLGVVGTVVMIVLNAFLPIAENAAAAFVAGVISTAVLALVLVRVWVIVPAIVFERAGPIACFRRSMALTKGRRWIVFGVFAAVVVANYAVNLLSNVLPQIGAPMAGAVLQAAATVFFLAFGAVLSAVGYYALRVEKEGAALSDIA